MKEWQKTAAMALALAVIWTIILTGLASSTPIYGSNAATVVGTVTVGGNLYYKGGVGGLPSGSILLFTTACPTGWTRQTTFDSTYIRISTTAGSTGGATTHTPTYSHTHDSGSISTGSSGATSHSHTLTAGLQSGGGHTHTAATSPNNCPSAATFGFWELQASSTTSNGAHTHSSTISVTSTNDDPNHSNHAVSGSSGSTSPTIGSANNDPTRISTVICKKD